MELADHDFERLKQFVESELQFSISYYNDEYLKRRIRSRMRRTKRTDLDAYLKHLQSNENEQEKLLRSFSINVTGFFRNPDVWKRVRQLLRELTTQKDGTCRVWSAGCADGREPYSIALLAIADPQVDDSSLEIVGTDINTEALDRARGRVYKNTITNDIADQLSFLTDPEQFVQTEGDRIKVSQAVADMVEFREHDLIRESPPAEFDLVFCRNVLIYLKRTHENDIFDTITSAMTDGSYIVIGKAETLPNETKPKFETVDAGLRVYRLNNE